MNDSTRLEVIARLVPHIMGEHPEEYFNTGSTDNSDIDMLKSLFADRKEILDKRYTETPDTINRIMEINDLLYGLKRKMLQRMLMLYRLNIQTGNNLDFDNMYKITGKIEIDAYVDPYAEIGTNTSIIEKPGDNLMRLDFPYMITAIRELYNHLPSEGKGYTTVQINASNIDDSYEPTADELFGCHYYELEDDKAWSDKESELRARNPFIQSPVEDLMNAYPLSIQDILRIKHFNVRVDLSIQSTQAL